MGLNLNKKMSAMIIALTFTVLSTPFTASAAATPTLSSRPVPVPGRVLVRFREGVKPQQKQNVIAGAKGREVDEIPQLNVKVIQLPANASATAQAKAFMKRSEVVSAEQEMAFPMQSVAGNDPYYPSQWHLSKIGAPTAWLTTLGSSSVTVAVLDTGVDSTHPDLASKIVPGWNTYDNTSNTADVQGHGTTTAGAACASSNNGIGVASPAWGCLLMPMRVTDTSGYAFSSTISSALAWAADNGAQVASISFEGVATSSTVSSAAQYFMNSGGIVCVAAGNSSTFMTAADNANLFVVSGTDSADNIASFSNTGNNIDVAAPAVSIYTTSKGGGYTAASGTSYCAPIVAGVAALIYSANPALTGKQVGDILEKTADDLGGAGWDAQFGCGRINAGNAVALAVATPANADVTAPTVSFKTPAASSTVFGTATISIAASDNMAVTAVGVYVDGKLVGTLTTSPFDYVWDTTTVADGTHTLAANAMDAAGNSTVVQISVKVANAPDTAAPVISIVSPTNGGRIKNSVSVRVSASDNVGVVKVELYVDGRLISTSTSAPFNTSWSSTKATSGTHTLVCKAYDAKGNVGTSAAVSVTK